MELFDYSPAKITAGNALFDEIVDCHLRVPCENRAEILDYIFRSYRYGEWLYITDIFPAIFENDTRCFKRFTSHEGYTVNMRRLAVTCVFAFIQEILSRNPLGVMVISGSYEDAELEAGPSRKLRLYDYFFRPILSEFGLRKVNMFDNNAFMLLQENSILSASEISLKYLEFKTKQQ